MKLAFCLFRYFPFGGVQRNFLRIAELCARKGHELHLYTLRWDGPPPGFRLNTHVVPVTAWRNHHRYEQFAAHVNAATSGGDFDLVVGFNKMPGLDLYYAGDPCFVQAAHARRSALYRLGGRYRHFERSERAVFAHDSDTHILLIAEAQKAHFQEWYGTPDERFHLLPPYISKDRFNRPPREEARQAIAAELGIAPDCDILLMIGSDYRRKGVARSIEALAALQPPLRKRSHLVVIGNGRTWLYRLLAKRRGVDSNVHLLGGRTDVPAFLAAADMLLHPAVEENTGTAIVEAISAGLPSLVTDTCGYVSHVRDSQSGCVVPSPFSQDTMNTMLERLLTSLDRETLRANALQYAASNDLSSRPERAVEVIEALRRAGGSESVLHFEKAVSR